MVPPHSCLATRQRRGCTPASMSLSDSRKQGGARQCLIRQTSIGRRDCRLYSIGVSTSLYIVMFDEPLHTLYLLASSIFPAAKLIADIALMAIIPLIARLVWLLGEESSGSSSASILSGLQF